MRKIAKITNKLNLGLITAIYMLFILFTSAFAEQNYIGDIPVAPTNQNFERATNTIENTEIKSKYENLKKLYKQQESLSGEGEEEVSEEKNIEKEGFSLKYLEKSNLEKEYESRIQGLKTTVKQFGYDFFQGKPVVNTNAPVSKDYVVGVGDKLVIYIKDTSISPNLPGVLKLTVNKNGEIYIPDIGTFYVVGARLEEIEDLLTSAIGSPVSVSLAGLRGFTVYVSGEVYRPGAVKVSNLNTVLDALMLAGGVKKTGSLRNVILTRASGQKIKLDLYKLLVFGKPINIRLRDGDVILVKPIGKTVAIIGKVKRPAIYEIKGGESIKDIIDLAGGLLPSAYKYKVILQRYTNHKYMKIETGRLDDESFIEKVAQSGDIIEIKSIYNKPLNFIEIKGAVKYPGRYAYRDGMKLSDLLTYENIKMNTNLDYAEIERRDPFTFEIKEIITFSPRDVLNGKKDIELQRLDTIRIYSRYTYKPIKVSGLISKPYIVPYRDNIKLSEALFNANFKDKIENLVVEIYRIEDLLVEDLTDKYSPFYGTDLNKEKDSNLVNKTNLRYKSNYYPTYKDNLKNRINLKNNYSELYKKLDEDKFINQPNGKNKYIYEDNDNQDYTYRFFKKIYLYDLLIKNNQNLNIELKPGDRLVIKRVSKNEIVKKVYIGGYVKKPGVYDISKYPTLYDVLKATGGFRKDAYPKGLIFLRERVAEIQYKKLELAVNLMKQSLLKEEAGMMRADISSTEQKGLEASYKARLKFLDTLKETQITGRISGIKVSYNLDKLKNSPFNIKLEDGDRIYIPPIPNDIYIFGEVYNPSTLVYMRGLTVEDYIL